MHLYLLAKYKHVKGDIFFGCFFIAAICIAQHTDSKN